MKKVDYEHFGRFQYPHTLRARGEDLYYCVRRADLDADGYKSDLWRLRGGEARRLTSSGDVNGFWLREGGIVFSALRDKKDKENAEKGLPLTVLQRLPYDGGEASEWLRLDYAVTDLRFVGEDRFFFTAVYSHELTAALAACGGDKAKAAEKLKEDADYRVVDELPFWANGSGYINKTRSRLYLYDAGEVKPVTDEFTNVSIASATPDGKKLYYIASRYTDMVPCFDRLYELDADTLQASDLSVEKASHGGAWPLPDGRLAVAANQTRRYGLNENFSVYLRENGAYRTLYDAGEHNFYNSVGSDVKTEGRSEPMAGDGCVYTLDTQDDSTCLVRLDAKTGEVRNLTREKGNITEAVLWDGGFAAIAMRGGQGCEVYRIGMDGKEERLTQINTALCGEYEYSAPQDVWFDNEVGDRIHGWVIPPVGREPGKTYPAILDIHGGPKTAYGSCYFHEMQLWAGRGYAVMFCNPTGSDGRGDRFADIRGQYGQRDYRDIMAFVDAATAQFDFIDPARMGVTGGSYGGFMTNWVIGHTGRFKAAASQRSIASWISFSNLSDIGFYFGGDQVGGDAWNDLEKIWAQSPLRYADKATTPTLFIHSDEDHRCPMAEGLQMFYALRAHGVPARCCIFKGENHELSRSGKPKHRVRRLREITEWFDRYLKAEEK